MNSPASKDRAQGERVASVLLSPYRASQINKEDQQSAILTVEEVRYYYPATVPGGG